MENNNTPNKDALDIIFANRNKEYGAYELRSNYKKRLRNALLIGAFGGAAVMALPALGGLIPKAKVEEKVRVKVTKLDQPPPLKKDVPPPPAQFPPVPGTPV
jgi:protein TonB